MKGEFLCMKHRESPTGILTGSIGIISKISILVNSYIYKR